jgi:hypothetical protein
MPPHQRLTSFFDTFFLIYQFELEAFDDIKAELGKIRERLRYFRRSFLVPLPLKTL